MAKQVRYLDLDGLKTLYGVVDGKITTAVNNAKGELKGGASADYDTLGKLEGKIKNEETRATGVETELSGKIGAMDLAKVGGTGKFVQSVSQSDGKVSAEAADLNAAAVAATAIEGSGSTVAVAGATVAEQIQSLGQTLKTVEGNAAKYKVVKLTPDEVTALGNANVKEAYQVVSYVGADAEGTAYTKVGEVIKIYKDGNLKSATLGDDQKLILTYTQSDGSDSSVEVDFAAIAFNAEFKNGLQVAKNGEISVQVDTASEKFLTVGADGVKLAGVQKAIDNAVAAKNVTAEGDYYITATAAGNKVSVKADVQSLTIQKIPGADSTIEGVAESLVDGAEVATKVASFTNARISEEIAKLYSETTSTGGGKVTVKVTEVNGKISAVNVTETDIASANALTSEVTRAKGAEDKIEASVGLAADGSFTAPAGKNYINGATTVMDAVVKLDVQAKANADKIAGMSVNEDNQTVTIDSKSLQFIAFTAQEIQNAANPAAGQ